MAGKDGVGRHQTLFASLLDFQNTPGLGAVLIIQSDFSEAKVVFLLTIGPGRFRDGSDLH